MTRKQQAAEQQSAFHWDWIWRNTHTYTYENRLHWYCQSNCGNNKQHYYSEWL